MEVLIMDNLPEGYEFFAEDYKRLVIENHNLKAENAALQDKIAAQKDSQGGFHAETFLITGTTYGFIYTAVYLLYINIKENGSILGWLFGMLIGGAISILIVILTLRQIRKNRE
ncbi:MAG: hypothetical protein IJM32_04090 [Ruminococcus sp.]|nr:hypothetical protein [Ruminococcus sp.]